MSYTFPVPDTSSIQPRPADLVFPNRIPKMKARVCMTCSGKVEGFDSELSQKEFLILKKSAWLHLVSVGIEFLRVHVLYNRAIDFSSLSLSLVKPEISGIAVVCGKLFELRGFNFSFVSSHIIRVVPCQKVHASNTHKITN